MAGEGDGGGGAWSFIVTAETAWDGPIGGFAKPECFSTIRCRGLVGPRCFSWGLSFSFVYVVPPTKLSLFFPPFFIGFRTVGPTGERWSCPASQVGEIRREGNRMNCNRYLISGQTEGVGNLMEFRRLLCNIPSMERWIIILQQWGWKRSS